MVTIRAMLLLVGLSLLNIFEVLANSDQTCDATDGEGRCLPVAGDHQSKQSLLQKTFAHAPAAHAPKEHRAKHHSKKKVANKDPDIVERRHDTKLLHLSHHAKKETKVATAHKKAKDVQEVKDHQKTVKQESKPKVQKANGVHHVRISPKHSSKPMKMTQTAEKLTVAESSLPLKR